MDNMYHSHFKPVYNASIKKALYIFPTALMQRNVGKEPQFSSGIRPIQNLKVLLTKPMPDWCHEESSCTGKQDKGQEPPFSAFGSGSTL